MTKPPLILVNVLFFIITASVAIFVVPVEAYFNSFDWKEVTACIALIWMSGMSITAGYHRLWSHKAYEAHTLVKVFYAIFGAMAVQRSILHWCSDHRIHHRHVDDNEKDPYSAKKGFWFSHLGWMLRDYKTNPFEDYANCRDLQKDKVVMWQHNNYGKISLAANIGIPAFLGWLNGDVLGMLLLAGVLRLVVVHHVTFFINSLAHLWGRQPYTDQNTAKDNDILAFFTFGEGYHNFHHIFEYDYRNGIRWWQFDPTKWLIKGLSWFKLTYNLRRCPEERIEKARLAMQLRYAKQQTLSLSPPNKDEILGKLQAEYDALMLKMTEFYQARKTFMDLKKQALIQSYEGLEIRYKYKELKASLEVQKNKWLDLSRMPLQYA